jgi:glutathione S-transferase
MDRMSDLYFNDPVVELLFQQFGFRAKDDERAARAKKYIAMTFGHWDRRLASQSWLCGKSFSMADCSAIPALFYAQVVAPLDDHLNVASYWKRAQERESYAKVKSEFEPIWDDIISGRQVA